MIKVLHLDENHEILENGLAKIGFKNFFDFKSNKKEITKKIEKFDGLVIRSRILIDEDLIGSQVLSSSSDGGVVTQSGNVITTTTTITSDIQNTFRQTFEESGVEREFGLELSAGQEVIDLGTKVVGIDVLYNVRSRNIQGKIQ